MPKVFTSKTQKTGEIGENIATRFLVKHGFSILERNYTKKWGEIDIIAEKGKKLYFVEVKSVSRETWNVLTYTSPQPSPYKGEGAIHDNWRAEDNMHPWKLKRLSRTIQTYLLSKKIPEEMEWQFDLLVVYLDMEGKKARVKVVKDIIL
ncbi:MAG: YraN family protein [Patescibacteria group bacterium]